MNVSLEQALGRAMVDADFQAKLFGDPEAVGREIGLSEEDIVLLKSMELRDFSEFRDKLSAQLGKSPIIPIFCASY